MSIKRLNLSFDLSREIDRRAYEILSQKSGKTVYVAKAVISYNNESDSLDSEALKNTLREVLREFYTSKDSIQIPDRNKKELSLPDEIFDIFNEL